MNSAQPPTRKVSILLGIGIFFIPLIFAWFTLRKGHSTLARVLSFVWLIASISLATSPKEPELNPETPARIAQTDIPMQTTSENIPASESVQITSTPAPTVTAEVKEPEQEKRPTLKLMDISDTDILTTLQEVKSRSKIDFKLENPRTLNDERKSRGITYPNSFLVELIGNYEDFSNLSGVTYMYGYTDNAMINLNSMAIVVSLAQTATKSDKSGAIAMQMMERNMKNIQKSAKQGKKDADIVEKQVVNGYVMELKTHLSLSGLTFFTIKKK